MNVLAYAAANPADPSAARRAVAGAGAGDPHRADGCRRAFARIYLRALGSAPGSVQPPPPDRADVTVMGANLPATAQADAGTGQNKHDTPHLYLIRMLLFLVAVAVVAGLLAPCSPASFRTISA